MTANTQPTPRPLLEPGHLYVAYDRVVCIDCAGATASYTGVTIGGCALYPVEPGDVTEWLATSRRLGIDLGPLRCEGEHLEAGITAAGQLRVMPVR